MLEGCHPWQRYAVLEIARFFTWLVGRGGGKTTAFLVRFLIGIVSITRGRFVYVAPTLGMATELLWDPLKDTIARLVQRGLCEEGDFEFKEIGKTVTCRRTGSRLRLVGGDDRRELDKLRGQPFDGVGVDEACVFPPDLLEVLAERIIIPRLGERNGWLGFASTPGHVLRGFFYERSSLAGVGKFHRPFADRNQKGYKGWRGWSSHTWSLKDVAELPNAGRLYPAIVANWRDALAKKEAEGISDDNPIWKRERLGLWALDETDTVFKYRPHDKDGKPFNQWDPAAGKTGIEQLHAAMVALPGDVPIADWRYVVSADMGHADPFALNVFMFCPADPKRRMFHAMGLERPAMYARPIAEILLGEELNTDAPGGVFMVTGWPDGLVMDADLAVIEELANVYGVRMQKAERKIDYKFGAIELTNGDLLEGRIFVLKDSPLEKQLQELQWTTDDFSGRKREHAAQANHSTDCLIYARKLIAQLFEVGVAAPPPPSGASSPGSPPMPPLDAHLPLEQRDDGSASLLASADYVDPWSSR